MYLYDVEFQLDGTDIWIRVNDCKAENEEEAEALAEKKLLEQLGIDVRPMKRWIEIPNYEEVKE